MAEYIINFIWDSEAAVWIATSNDIKGLILESGSLDVLMERVRYTVPELLELNGTEKHEFPMCFRVERHERVQM